MDELPRSLSTFRAQLTDTERETYDRAGYWRSFGLGVRPALLIIDVEYNFTGDVDEPILDSLRKYSDSCGPAAWAAVPSIAQLLGIAREMGYPVVFTHGEPAESLDVSRVGTQIVDELAPVPGELVTAKSSASAFFDTDLAAWLRTRQVDTVVHTGCTTSGCVRASVVDAAAHGFRNAVVEEAVFDRAYAPHCANLFDMHAKYADVLCVGDAARYLRSPEAFNSA